MLRKELSKVRQANRTFTFQTRIWLPSNWTVTRILYGQTKVVPTMIVNNPAAYTGIVVDPDRVGNYPRSQPVLGFFICKLIYSHSCYRNMPANYQQITWGVHFSDAMRWQPIEPEHVTHSYTLYTCQPACLLVLSRYPITRCDTYRDTWVTMRYVSRYLFIGLVSA